jgi:hypothetical protein
VLLVALATPVAANTSDSSTSLPGTSSPTTQGYDTVQANAPVYNQVLVGWTPAGAAPPPYRLPSTTRYVEQSYIERVPVPKTRRVPYLDTVTKTRKVTYTERVKKDTHREGVQAGQKDGNQD